MANRDPVEGAWCWYWSGEFAGARGRGMQCYGASGVCCSDSQGSSATLLLPVWHVVMMCWVVNLLAYTYT